MSQPRPLPLSLPTDWGSYEILECLAPFAARYLGIGVQEGNCVDHVVRAHRHIDLILCDTWGAQHGGTGRGDHLHVENRLILAGHAGDVLWLDGPSQDLIPTLGTAPFIDLSYVDGSHEEADAAADFRNVWPRTRWAMVVHDIRMGPVWKALTEFMDTIEGQATMSCAMGGHGTAVVWRRT